MRQFRRYDPTVSRRAAGMALVLFVVMLAATLAFLWNAEALSLAQQAGCAAAIVAGVWLVGLLCSPPQVEPADVDAPEAPRRA